MRAVTLTFLVSLVTLIFTVSTGERVQNLLSQLSQISENMDKSSVPVLEEPTEFLYETSTQAVSQSLPTSSAFTATEKDKMVKYHNYFRCSVTPAAANMQAIVWDEELAIQAQAWADTCPQSTHSTGTGYGENMAYSQNPADGIEFAMEGWDFEKHDYDFDTNGPSTPGKVVGHYTQEVWASSNRIGCGSKVCSYGRQIVCQYTAQGNFVGQSPYVKATNNNNNAACSAPNEPIPQITNSNGCTVEKIGGKCVGVNGNLDVGQQTKKLSIHCYGGGSSYGTKYSKQFIDSLGGNYGPNFYSLELSCPHQAATCSVNCE